MSQSFLIAIFLTTALATICPSDCAANEICLNEVCVCKEYYISPDCSILTLKIENDRANNFIIQSGESVYLLTSNYARDLKSEILGLGNANAILYILDYKGSSSVPSSINYDAKHILELGSHTYEISKLDYRDSERVIICIHNPSFSFMDITLTFSELKDESSKEGIASNYVVIGLIIGSV
jgi:hypothetical protein